jgi:hypothetical protein
MMSALICVKVLDESSYAEEFIRKDLSEEIKNVFSQLYCRETKTNIDCGLYELLKIGALKIPNF